MNWDDLRVALAVLKNGSYASAARELRVNETTISRRLARLEEDLGYKIFQTVNGERVPTAAGQMALNAGVMMERESERLRLSEGEQKAPARRRIAAVEAMATHFLAPRVGALVAEQPHLQLEILLSTEAASFSRWETDIALRLTRPEKGNMAIRKLAEFEWVLVEPAAQEAKFFCGYTAQHVRRDERRALLERLPRGLPMVVVNGMSPIKRILLQGEAVCFLPDFMCGDLWDNPALKLETLGLTRPIWLLVQEHLRHDEDTQLVTDWIAEAFAA